MIYQVFHAPELYEQCDRTSAKNRPIGVGKAALWCQSQGLLNDAAGADNINHLNAQLNEWTAIYWAWRNLATLDDGDDWIGFSHYRRPGPAFLRRDENEMVSQLLKDNDVLAWIPNASSLAAQAAPHHPGLIDTILASIGAFFSEAMCAEAAMMVNAQIIHPYSNCFVMKKDRFMNDYAPWCWTMLEVLADAALRNVKDMVPYDLSKPRNLGFLSERLLPLYCMLDRAKVTFFIEGHQHLLPRRDALLTGTAVAAPAANELAKA